HDFFARYIEGHEVADYGRLLARAGFTLRRSHAGRAWLGDLRVEASGGAARAPNPGGPARPIYAAGGDQDDELQQIEGQRIASGGDLAGVLQRHKPGDTVSIVYVDRTRVAKTASVTLAEDPHVEVAVGEASAAQREFRDRWLDSR